MEKFFELKKHGTNVRTEVIAGITTFVTMAYILIVNPDLLGATGMNTTGVFMATAISSCIATLVMALVAKLPFALAPGMGLNAFFAFSVVLGMGYSWELALTAVFAEGIIFIILTFFNVREAIINCIPHEIKKAISVGIGLFIAFIGLQGAGVIVDDMATLVTHGTLLSPTVAVAVVGLVVMAVLHAFKVKGSLLIGILAATVVGMLNGVTPIKNFSFGNPFDGFAALGDVAFKLEIPSGGKAWLDFITILFTFLMVDMFDTVGTLVGVSTKAGMLDKEGKIPRVKQALLADAIGTTAGALLGTSTVTTYVESASGVEAGGRTGLTSLTTAVLFFLAIFLAPVFLLIPGAATAPALIMVGVFMMSPILEIDWKHGSITTTLPAFLTLVMMPLSYSISEGIAWGVVSFVILKILTGKAKEIHPFTYVVALLFMINWFF